YIPVCRKKTGVHHSHIPAVTFNLLHIPQGKSVIISNSKEDGIFINAIQVHFSHCQGGISARPVMVIPVLRHQYGWYCQESNSYSERGCNARFDLRFEKIEDCINSKAHPDRKNIKGTHKGIISFARFKRSFI